MPMLHIVWGVLISFIPWLMSSVFKAIGLGFVTYIGLTVGLDYAESFVFSKFEGIASQLFQILVLMGIPEGIKILFSAFAVALVLKTGSKGGTVRRPVWKKPGPFEA